MPSSLGLLAEQILVGSWKTSVTSFAQGRVAEHDGVVVAMTGIDSPSNNPAFVVADPADAITALRWGIDERGGLASGYDIAVGRRPGIEDALAAIGHVRLLERPAMALRIDAMTLRPRPAELRLERVDSAEAIFEAATVQAASFHADLDGELAALPRSLVTADHSCLILGRVDGVAVTCAFGARGPGGVAIFGVATLPDEQGQGYATAATGAAIRAIAGPHEHAVLQASSAGHSVYEAMGFADVGAWAVWVSPEERDAKLAKDSGSS